MLRLGNMQSPLAGSTPNRLAWVDTARAACVVAVVAYHLYLWHFVAMGVPSESIASTVWEQTNRLLSALRMPLLLVLSGTLASGRIRRGFGRGKASQSIVSNYYLYVVWLLVYVVLGQMTGGLSPIGDLDGSLPALVQVLIPDTTLWFIYALAVYVPVFILARKAKPALVLAALAIVNVVCAMFAYEAEPSWLKVIRLAIYFAIGVYGKDLIFQLAATRKYALACVGTVTAVALTGLSVMPIPEVLHESLYLLRALAFTAALIGITAALVRFRSIAALGRWVGSRTLPIYVIHPLIIIGLSILAEGPLSGPLSAIADNTVLALIYPAVTTIIVVGACVLAEQLCHACRLQAPFRAPEWLMRRWEKGE